jgi:ADP-heptose:LPS heptosyltransferase
VKAELAIIRLPAASASRNLTKTGISIGKCLLMPLEKLSYTDLRSRFSDTDSKRLNSFLQAIEDHEFQSSLAAEKIFDLRLAEDKGPAVLPSAETVLVDDTQSLPSVTGQADLVVAAGILQRVNNPFRLLNAIQPLLKVNGTLILSVPLRDMIDGQSSYHGSARHKRLYTISSLFLELQAAWGFNAFRIRFAKEYDGRSILPAATTGTQPHSLILVVEKRGERQLYPDIPQLALDRPGAVYNRRDEEALMSIDVGSILSPGLDPASFKRICVLKLDHIGDFIMGVPVFDDIRQTFPNAHIVCVCGSWNVSLARDLGCFDEIVQCDYYSSGADGAHGAETMAAAAQKLGDQLRDTRFDLAIDLRVPPDSRAIIQVVPARYRAAIGSAEQFPFLDVALPAIDSFNVSIHNALEAALIYIPAESFAVRSAEAASPPGLRVLHATVNEHLIWGPYTKLDRGCYRVTWMLTTAPRTVSVKVDVTIHDPMSDGVTVLAEAVIDVGPTGTSSTLDVELHTDLTRVEFRVQPLEGAADAIFAFTGVRLEAISGRPTIRNLSPAQVHMKEHMALLLGLVRTRLLAPVRTPEEIRTALRASDHADSEPFFVIVPFSNSALRNWPMAGFRGLSQMLIAQTTAKVYFVGSSAQRPALDALIAEIGSSRIENHAGAPWSDIYSSFARAEAVITNNSGMGHVAALLGAQVVAIYSGSHQVLEWGPVGPRVSVLQTALPCGACGFDTTAECLHGLRCMQAINPPAVIQALRTVAPASFLADQAASEPSAISEPVAVHGSAEDAGLMGRLRRFVRLFSATH